MVVMEGKYVNERDEDLDEYFKAIGEVFEKIYLYEYDLE